MRCIKQHYVTHQIVLGTLSLRSRALQRCGSIVTTRCSGGFKSLPSAAVSPPQAPLEAAFYSTRAGLAVSERKLMIQAKLHKTQKEHTILLRSKENTGQDESLGWNADVLASH